MKKYNEINIRFTHPNLYWGILTFACINIGLGLNFLFTMPTFNPYQIDKTIVGSIFLLLGLSKLIFLLLVHNLKAVRVVMALEVAFMIFWGIGTSITFFQGRTSLQLFVLYIGLAVLEITRLTEPGINPLTKVREKK